MAYFRGPNIVRDGLVFYLDAANTKSYPTSGTTWSDLSGNGNNGTLINGPTFNSSNNGSIVFDGVNDYVDCGNNSIFSFTQGGGVDIPFSINAWVNLVSYGTGALVYTMILSKSQYTTDWFREFALSHNSIRLSFVIYTNNNNYIAISSIDALNLNTWYNVCLTYDGSKTISGMKLYINSVQQSTTSTSVGTYTGITNTNTPVNIGRQNNQIGDSGYLSGNVSNLFIYRNKTLTSSEVLQNYEATKSRYNL